MHAPFLLAESFQSGRGKVFRVQEHDQRQAEYFHGCELHCEPCKYFIIITFRLQTHWNVLKFVICNYVNVCGHVRIWWQWFEILDWFTVPILMEHLLPWIQECSLMCFCRWKWSRTWFGTSSRTKRPWGLTTSSSCPPWPSRTFCQSPYSVRPRWDIFRCDLVWRCPMFL